MSGEDDALGDPARLPLTPPSGPIAAAVDEAFNLAADRLLEVPELRDAPGRLMLVFECRLANGEEVHAATVRPPDPREGMIAAEHAVTSFARELRPQG